MVVLDKTRLTGRLPIKNPSLRGIFYFVRAGALCTLSLLSRTSLHKID